MGSNHMHELFRSNRQISNRFLEKGESKVLRGNQFRNGISAPLTFELGKNFSEKTSSSSLKFTLTSELYYGKTQFRAGGQSLPYYGQEKNWNKNILKNKAKVFFDLRDAVPYGEEFDYNLINDGYGGYGENCVINLTPIYETI